MSFCDVICMSDGNHLAVGRTYSVGNGHRDWYMVKADPNSDTLWTRTFGGYYFDDANAVVETPEGDYMVGGYISGDTSTYGDFALVKVSPSGDSLWGRKYGTRDDEVAYSPKR